MNIQTQIENLKNLSLPKSDFIVVSSGSLAIRGIRDAKDIDVIVTPFLWSELARKHPVTKNDWGISRIELGSSIEILNPEESIFGNSKVVPVEEIFSQADESSGVRFMNLEHLRKIKQSLAREVDLHDIGLIDEYMKRN